jgi:hypothetical protein
MKKMAHIKSCTAFNLVTPVREGEKNFEPIKQHRV